MTQCTYQIRVRGAVPADFLARLPVGTGSTIDAAPETVFVVEGVGQAELHALIGRMENLGLDLREVRMVSGTGHLGDAPADRVVEQHRVGQS